MSITRCVGFVPTVNGMVIPVFPLPGGGYEGKTRRLDRAVLNAAKWMQAQFGLPVTVRFNSDRHSGGAWLVDRKRDDASVTIGAHIIMPRHLRRRWQEQTGPYKRLHDFWQPSEIDAIGFSVCIHVDFLLQTEDRGKSWLAHTGWWNFPTTRQARRFLLSRLDMPRVQRLLKVG